MTDGRAWRRQWIAVEKDVDDGGASRANTDVNRREHEHSHKASTRRDARANRYRYTRMNMCEPMTKHSEWHTNTREACGGTRKGSKVPRRMQL